MDDIFKPNALSTDFHIVQVFDEKLREAQDERDVFILSRELKEDILRIATQKNMSYVDVLISPLYITEDAKKALGIIVPFEDEQGIYTSIISELFFSETSGFDEIIRKKSLVTSYVRNMK